MDITRALAAAHTAYVTDLVIQWLMSQPLHCKDAVGLAKTGGDVPLLLTGVILYAPTGAELRCELSESDYDRVDWGRLVCDLKAGRLAAPYQDVYQAEQGCIVAPNVADVTE